MAQVHAVLYAYDIVQTHTSEWMRCSECGYTDRETRNGMDWFERSWRGRAQCECRCSTERWHRVVVAATLRLGLLPEQDGLGERMRVIDDRWTAARTALHRWVEQVRVPLTCIYRSRLISTGGRSCMDRAERPWDKPQELGRRQSGGGDAGGGARGRGSRGGRGGVD